MENVLCGSVSVQCQGRGNDDITDNAVDGVIIGGIAAAVRFFTRCPESSQSLPDALSFQEENSTTFCINTITSESIFLPT